MSRLFVCCCALLAIAATVRAAECHGKPDPNAKPNMNAIWTEKPVFKRAVANGKLYTVGTGDDEVPIVHLWGTPYQKGYAHGELMREGAVAMMNATWSYFAHQVEQALNGTATKLHIPAWVVDMVANFGLEVTLDLTYDATVQFTGDYFYEEMHGLADASGANYDTIRRIHMIGELTKGTCSMYGAWGTATASLGGKLMQLRALDWAVDGPFKNFPQLTVYHGNGSANQGNSFINVGWTGWIGSITGVSEKKIGICEIGVSYPDSTFGNESRIGIPFTNILRDIIQFDSSLSAGLDRIKNANRTCDLILGVGDGNANAFRGVQYSHSVANFFDDKDMMPYNETWHPRMDDVVYYGMDWICPNYNVVLARQLKAFHGNITAENTIHYITPIVQTGDLHVAIYDFAQSMLYVANARPDGGSGPANAYDRQFSRVNMTDIFGEAPPALQIA